MIQFLEEAGNIQKRTGETSERNSPLRLKRSQVSGLENSIQALLSTDSPSLPIHVHLLPTGSGKTTLAMGQILAARLRDIPLQKRTHVQSNTESNLTQLYQTARDLYGSSLGKIGFIPETSSETMAKKIAQESDILFLTTGKQGELHALEKERGQNRKRWEKNNSFILDMNRRTGVKIVDEIDALLYSPAHQIDGGSEKIRWDSPSGQFWRFVGQTAEMIAEKRRPLAELEKLERGAVKRIWKKSQGLGFAYSQTETGRILKNSVQALEDRKGEDYAIVHGEIKLIQSGVAKNLVKEAGYLQALEHKYGLRKLTPPRPLNEKRFAQTDLDALKAGHGPVLGNSATLTPSAQEVLRAAFRLDSQPPPIFVTGEPSPQVPNFEMRTRKNLKELYRKAASLTRDPKDQVFLGSFSAEQARIFRNVLVKSGLANVRDIFLAGSVTPGERIFQAVRSGRYRITLGNADQIGRGLDLKQVLGTERLKVIGFNTAVSPESTLIQLFGRALGERSKRWRKQPKFYLLSDQETLDRTVPKPIREQVRRSGGWDSRKLKELLPKIQTLSEKKALEPSRSNISSKSGTRQKNRHFLSNTKPLFINFFANKNWMKNMFPIRSYAQRDGNLFLGGARPRGLARRRSRQNASAEISDAPKKRFPSRFVMPEGGTFPIKRLKYYLAQIAENYSKHNPLLFKFVTQEVMMKIKEKLLSVAKVKKTPLMLSLSKHERSAFGNSRPSTSSGRAVSIALLMQHSIKANNPTNFKKTVVKQVIQQSPKQQTKNQGWKPFEWRHHIPKFWKNVSSYHKISNKEGSGNFTAGMRSGMKNLFAGALAPAGSLDGELGRKKVPSSPTPREKVFHPASLGQKGVRPRKNGLNYFQTLKRYLNSKDAEKVFKRQQ
ncbi:MAG: hypothetical protein HYY63_01510 [Elusimicrobia bacterium]|nr:hypothetical protein [Elusimicrobiota bacterium]